MPGIQTILSCLSTTIGRTNFSKLDNLLLMNKSLTNTCLLLEAEYILSPLFQRLRYSPFEIYY